ncbi:MAG: lipoprotein-releasing system ATP-binding protein LolD [Candidatus Omnitrophica bacterium CG07_land_8_20_14_0_80_42_15]|uniref:Lipoprotein-releasing system ATP-binding protein LolD n=1 Tax=Candidatus Aquitaenariimonas noxiae TaxID=1974741 RepID=A0A2J0KUG8_9BACT|nr:MAG: lipoprotein-releasing system ATP-binding protein LolD [Candidatus Omnitrophica bacterium CG07_land_8_20_14_0_80_42_15]
MILAKNIHKIYTQGNCKIEALNGVDLELKKGESLLIVGPSGAGKSTLLHIVGGLDTPTIGEVFFNGMNLYSLKDEERAKIRNKKMGFVFQFYHLLPEFSALENIMLPAFISKDARPTRVIKESAMNLLETVGLADRRSHKPRELSGGEAQRVAIARALINEPDVILADEPTGNLDSEMGSQIYDILWKINKESGTALIIVSHNEMMREDFNKTYYMEDGNIKNKEALWV